MRQLPDKLTGHRSYWNSKLSPSS